MSDHDFDFESQPGLPKPLPEGETLLWQGSPDSAALAREAFKANWVLGYLLAIAVWRASIAFADGGFALSVAVFLPYLALALVGYGIVRLLARASAKAAIYSITTHRVILRIGAALQVTWTVPFTQVASASLSTRPMTGTGTVALDLVPGQNISYLALWPHLRPGFAKKTQPAFRCIPDAARVARILSDAAQTRVNEPVVSFAPQSALAAE
ncbi:MAG: photosynthetic complex putative assembly protein PuhB [Tabrizicola sp.]|uniref:photosynthetic complex putative assembly protein PuhB n=1 Tax=Tabrizicola sp. TaxID=2005166 RepID=UPI002ABA8981|nr:photosynthetic complex putative assembly protein PuhB [Tabrizicola sp.]MDZ4089214.1 photosynthetic complex putative assembly protein PuhB [Tabrizicola sp.]